MDYIVIVDEKDAVGPFSDYSDAFAYAEDRKEWRILPLTAPDEED